MEELTNTDKHAVLEIRRKHFCQAVSLSYANSNPLLIVEGRESTLIDETGTEYLDARNNVAHVGHCHPAVARAVQRQVARLNTNTRYLHPHVTSLARRTARTVPCRAPSAHSGNARTLRKLVCGKSK